MEATVRKPRRSPNVVSVGDKLWHGDVIVAVQPDGVLVDTPFGTSYVIGYDEAAQRISA